MLNFLTPLVLAHSQRVTSSAARWSYCEKSAPFLVEEGQLLVCLSVAFPFLRFWSFFFPFLFSRFVSASKNNASLSVFSCYSSSFRVFISSCGRCWFSLSRLIFPSLTVMRPATHFVAICSIVCPLFNVSKILCQADSHFVSFSVWRVNKKNYFYDQLVTSIDKL